MNKLDSIVDYLKVFNNIETYKKPEPRTMAQAPLANELEPGALRDEMLKGFDPSQETYEEYLQRISLERPFNAAHGGRIGFRKGLGLGKGRPGVKKDYKTSMEQLYTPEVQKKRIQTVKNIYQSKPVGKRVQWIADNGKNYDTPKDFIKAYEKHFGHKLGSKTDALFYFSDQPGPRGGVGVKGGKKINLGLVDNLSNPGVGGKSGEELLWISKNFSEEELFKGSILQNNPKVQKQFKNLFKNIHDNVSVYGELGPEGIVERLKKDGGNLLEDFDFIKAHSAGGQQTYGGVHRGITRNSLRNLKIPEEHLVSYQSVRQPLRAIEQIMADLQNKGARKRWGIGSGTAQKITGQLDNFLSGQGEVRSVINKINYSLGDKRFNEIFGGVNFEHTLAKQLGKDYKYLPRNYLLKGQFTSQAFNLMKKEAFDLPLIEMMKKYEQGKVSGKQIQDFINDFNAKTNNYVDFKFDPKVNKGKGGLSYLDSKVSYDLSKYKNPGAARDELVKNIELTMSPEFQKGMKKTVGASDQLKLFKSKKAKDLLQMLKKANVPCIKGEGGQCTSIVDYQKGYNKLVQEGAEGSKAAITKLGKFTKGMRALTGAAKWTGYGLLAEAGFMVPFAIGDYAAGESWKRILGNATDYGFGPIFGQSEQEEFEAALPEGSAAPQRRNIMELGERLHKMEEQKVNPGYGRVGFEEKAPEHRQKVYDSILDKYILNMQPFIGTSPHLEESRFYDQGLMDKAEQEDIATMNKLAEERQARIDERIERGIIADKNWQSQVQGRADGGIMNLKTKW